MLFIKIFQTGTGDQYCRANILSLLTIVIIFSLFDPFSQKWNVGLEEGKNKRSDGETRHLLRSVSLDSVTFKIWSNWWLFMVWGLIGVALYLLELSLEVRYCKPVRLQTPSSTTSSTSTPASSPSSSPSQPPPLILTHQDANEDDLLTSNLQTSLLTVSPVAAEISSPNLINEQRNLNNDHITFGEPPSQKIAFVHCPGLLLKRLNGCHLLTGERGKWAWYASPADRREPPPLIGGLLNFSPISLLGVERNRKAKAALADWRFAELFIYF